MLESASYLNRCTMLLATVFIIIGLVLLVFGGELLVRSSITIGHWCKMSELVIGLTLVAFGTSAPEFAVSIQAAISGSTELAITNVVGSNIANIALVLALSAVFAPMLVESGAIKRDLPIMFVCYIAVLVALIDGQIVRTEGMVALVGLVTYLYFLVSWSRRQYGADAVVSEMQLEMEAHFDDTDSPIKTILFLIGGIVMLWFGGDLLVKGAKEIALYLGVSEAVIGISVVAIGTSLPEIAASVMALIKGRADMAVGNVVGSNIWNTLGVLGVSSSLTPLDQGDVSWDMLMVMIGVAVVLWLSGVITKKFGRLPGGALVIGYVAYQYWLFTS